VRVGRIEFPRSIFNRFISQLRDILKNIFRCLQCKTFLAFFISLSLVLSGCSGGAATSAAGGNSSPSPADVARITPAQLSKYNSAQISGLGVNIKYLSNDCLAAMSFVSTAAVSTGSGQVGAITAEQIAVLTPAQVRMIGAVGPGGSITTSQITQLNNGAWAALVSDPAQVAAITAAEVSILLDTQITAMGTNIQYLSDEALNTLTPWTAGRILTGQIESITVAQIGVLTTAQVRMIGAAGPGGSVITSMIHWLNSGAWAALVSNQTQVAAITAAEISTLSDAEIALIGNNIASLSDSALGALSSSTSASPLHMIGQIESITAAQILSLAPAQVRFIGSTGVGGAVTTSQIYRLNSGAWASLVSDPIQVAAITPAEIATLTLNNSSFITALGTNINFLSDAALGSLTGNTWGINNGGQIQAISAAQVSALSPSQISIIAAINVTAANATVYSGIAFLNSGAFSTLSPTQISILTTTQKASLSVAQHNACGC
jgi:hypothetical protein